MAKKHFRLISEVYEQAKFGFVIKYCKLPTAIIGVAIFGGVFFLQKPAHAAASDIYIDQSGSGSQNGTDCADAYPVTFFNTAANWGTGPGQIGPGTTVYLCGTFTASAGASGYLTFQGSGTSGNPITLKFEPGAILQAPYWGGTPNVSGGAVDTGGNSYVTIDGGSDGVIQATANGTNLANQQGTTVGVFANHGSNVTIKNLTVANLYVHANNLSDESGQDTYGIWIANGNNLTVTANTIHATKWGITTEFDTNMYSNLVISDNQIYNIDHGIFHNAGSSSGGQSGTQIFGNTIHDFANWDDTADNNHHDGIHVNANAGTSLSGIQIYNNYIYGDPGINGNTFIFSFPTAGTITSPIQIFNNTLSDTSATHLTADGFVALDNVSGTIVNNTLLNPGSGSASGGTQPTGVHLYTAGTNTVENNIFSGLSEPLDFAVSGTISNYNDFYGVPVNGGWEEPTNTYYSSLASWVTGTGHDAASITSNPNLNSSYVPQSGSPVISAGTNLTSLCSGQPNPGLGALCYDSNGIARPTTGAWDIGAYQYSSPAIPGNQSSSGASASSNAKPNPKSPDTGFRLVAADTALASFVSILAAAVLLYASHRFKRTLANKK